MLTYSRAGVFTALIVSLTAPISASRAGFDAAVCSGYAEAKDIDACCIELGVPPDQCKSQMARESKEETVAFDVSVSTSIEGHARPVVTGNTNLPNGTSLMVTLSREQDAYRAQSKAVVSQGTFRAGPFTNKEAPLIPGIYSVKVSTPLAILQSPEVQMVIGKKGEKLAGPLIETSPIGDRFVRFQDEIRIGEDQASGRFDPVDSVKAYPCKQGGTIHLCIGKKLSSPVVSDLGWSVKEASGKYIVEKEIQVEGLRSPTIYRWSVTPDGGVSAENGHAISLSGR